MGESFFQSSIKDLLEQVTKLYSISDISTELQVNQSTIHRWLNVLYSQNHSLQTD